MPGRLIELLTITSRLAAIQRFGMERLSSPESVLEHLGAVALYAFAISVELDARDQGEIVLTVDENEPISFGAIERALVHDLDELVTGDVARPTKYATIESAALFKLLSKDAIKKVTADLTGAGLSKFARDVAEAYASAKAGRRGAVVALADILAVVSVVWNEVILHGNASVIRQAHTVSRQLIAFRERIETEFAGDQLAFLDGLVDEAEAIVDEAIARDAPINGTRVEVY